MSAGAPSEPLRPSTADVPAGVCEGAVPLPQQRARTSRFRVTCPSCSADLTLSARRLVVHVDPGTPATGELLFICLSCDATVTLGVDSASVATLVGSGAAVLATPPRAPAD